MIRFSPVVNLPEPISFKTLLDSSWPEETFVEEGILSRGDSMLIAAESKAGKSTLLGSLNRELISGGNFLGFKVSKPLRILLMQAEVRESHLKKRFEMKYSEVPSALLSGSYIWNTRGLILVDQHQQLVKSWIDKIKPDVLILDPLVNFHNYDENNATQMSHFFRTLDAIKHEFNLSLILSHHFRKKEQGKSSGNTSLLEMIRGSSVMRGWVDTVIAMEGRHKSEYRRLEFDTRNSDKSIKRIIKYNLATKEFDYHDPVGKVYKMLTEAMDGNNLPTSQVINLILTKCGELVGKNRNRAFELKDTLVESGQLVPTESGKTTFLRIV